MNFYGELTLTKFLQKTVTRKLATLLTGRPYLSFSEVARNLIDLASDVRADIFQNWLDWTAHFTYQLT